MKDNLSIVITMLVFVVLVIIFPLYNYFERQDDMSYNLALKTTTNFVDSVLNSGYIDQEMYNNFTTDLSATGNVYDVELEAHKKIYSKDDNNEYNEQYSIDYNDDIISYFDENKNDLNAKKIKNDIYYLSKDDQFYVRLKNSNTTMAGAIFDTIVPTSSKDRIVVDYGGVVKNTAWDYVYANFSGKIYTFSIDISIKNNGIIDDNVTLDTLRDNYGISVKFNNENANINDLTNISRGTNVSLSVDKNKEVYSENIVYWEDTDTGEVTIDSINENKRLILVIEKSSSDSNTDSNTNILTLKSYTLWYDNDKTNSKRYNKPMGKVTWSWSDNNGNTVSDEILGSYEDAVTLFDDMKDLDKNVISEVLNVPIDKKVTLFADPLPGFEFVKWVKVSTAGDVLATINQSKVVINMNENITYEAVFKPKFITNSNCKFGYENFNLYYRTYAASYDNFTGKGDETRWEESRYSVYIEPDDETKQKYKFVINNNNSKRRQEKNMICVSNNEENTYFEKNKRIELKFKITIKFDFGNDKFEIVDPDILTKFSNEDFNFVLVNDSIYEFSYDDWKDIYKVRLRLLKKIYSKKHFTIQTKYSGESRARTLKFCIYFGPYPPNKVVISE